MMSNLVLRVIVLCLVILATVSGVLAAEPERRIFISGCNFGSVMLIDGESRVIWQMEEKHEVSDIWLLESGNIVYSRKNGIREVRPNYALGVGAEIIWEVKSPTGSECHACQPIGEDRFLVGYSSNEGSYLVEIDSKGNEYKKIEVEGQKGAHTSFRQVRKTVAGTYLTSQQKNGGKSREYSSDGTLMRTFPAGRFACERLENGNTMIACGDEHRLIEVDKDNNIVWEVGQNDIEGVTFGFIADFAILSNGNIMVCNWGGHGGSSGGAVVEITRDKKLVWSTDKNINGFVSSIYLVRE